MEGTEKLDWEGIGSETFSPVGRKRDDPGVSGWQQGYQLLSGAAMAGELPSTLFP